MDRLLINADRSLPALVHAGEEAWIPSPEPGVERRMLERIGGEVALASSIVRYLPGSRFPEHVHDLGEEFLVLEGTFSDEDGHYTEGTYVRNPPGSRHSPFSDDGCVIFVKLRQMDAAETRSLRVHVSDRDWVPSASDGRASAVLFRAGRVTVELERLAAGVALAPGQDVGGEELFVLEGSVRLFDVEGTILRRWSWLRSPGKSVAGVAGPYGAVLWVKRGHL